MAEDALQRDRPRTLHEPQEERPPGTPEPGGMTSADLLWACRELAGHLEIVGMDVVEVLPTAVASADITALVAERVVRETLTGIAVRRSRAGQ